MTFRKASLAFLTIGLITASTTSIASGSFSSRGGSGIQDPYNYGKIVLHKKLICNSCPMKSENFNKMEAKKMMMKVSANSEEMQSLNKKERKAVAFYLNKRFDIQ